MRSHFSILIWIGFFKTFLLLDRCLILVQFLLLKHIYYISCTKALLSLPASVWSLKFNELSLISHWDAMVTAVSFLFFCSCSFFPLFSFSISSFSLWVWVHVCLFVCYGAAGQSKWSNKASKNVFLTQYPCALFSSLLWACCSQSFSYDDLWPWPVNLRGQRGPKPLSPCLQLKQLACTGGGERTMP